PISIQAALAPSSPLSNSATTAISGAPFGANASNQALFFRCIDFIFSVDTSWAVAGQYRFRIPQQVRAIPSAADRKSAERRRQFERRYGHGALADGYRNGFPGVPLLPESP